MNEEKSRMTLNISAQNRELIYQLVAKKTLGFNSLSTKEIFKYASALGLNKPSNLKNSDTYVRVDYLHTSDKALLITTKLGKAKTIAQIDEYCNIEHSYRIFRHFARIESIDQTFSSYCRCGMNINSLSTQE